MSATKKSQRTFLAVTSITVLAVAMVFAVYAVLLKSYTGGVVTIQSIGGSVQYSVTNSTSASWTGTIDQGANAEWYARISISNSPAQNVTVMWTLEKNVTGSWTLQSTPSAPTTTMRIELTTDYVYASSNGLIAVNYNWGNYTQTEGQYRILANIYTNP